MTEFRDIEGGLRAVLSVVPDTTCEESS